jgi:hypothetical protein
VLTSVRLGQDVQVECAVGEACRLIRLEVRDDQSVRHVDANLVAAQSATRVGVSRVYRPKRVRAAVTASIPLPDIPT